MKKNQQLKKRKKILYELMCCKEYEPMRARDLAVLLQIPSGKREELHKILDLLLAEGKITISKRGKYEAVRNPEKKQERSYEKREKELKEKVIRAIKRDIAIQALLSATPEASALWKYREKRRNRIFLFLRIRSAGRFMEILCRSRCRERKKKAAVARE